MNPDYKQNTSWWVESEARYTGSGLLCGFSACGRKQKSRKITKPPTDRKSSIWAFPGKFVFYQTIERHTASRQLLTLKLEYVWVVIKPCIGFQIELQKGIYSILRT